MRTPMLAALIAAVAIPAMPAMAQNNPRQANREYNREVRDAQRDYRRDVRRADDPRDVRRADREYRREVRDARKDRREDLRDWRRYRNYDHNRLPPGQRAYYADSFYRDGNYYQPRRLGRNDRVYVGQNGRYYCRRNDGTTGLIIGGLAGGVLGNVLAPGGSGLLGTILGAAGGGVLGNVIDRGQVVCR